MKRARNARRRSVPVQPATVDAVAGGTTLAIAAVPPRNPFVAHAHRRKAGAHGGSARTRRQAEKRELKKLLGE